MQILIDIPEHIYDTLECSKELIKEVVCAESVSNNMKIQWALLNGIPLAKGHGRLIDVDWVLNKMDNADASLLPRTINEYYAWNFAQVLLTQAPTIIEADKKNVGEE